MVHKDYVKLAFRSFNNLACATLFIELNVYVRKYIPIMWIWQYLNIPLDHHHHKSLAHNKSATRYELNRLLFEHIKVSLIQNQRNII